MFTYIFFINFRTLEKQTDGPVDKVTYTELTFPYLSSNSYPHPIIPPERFRTCSRSPWVGSTKERKQRVTDKG